MALVSAPPDAAARPARTLVARHPLIAYFTLAYLLSWLVEIPLVATARGWTTHRVPFALHYLAAYGPLVAALITTAAVDGADGLRRLRRRVLQWRVRPIWWLAAGAPLLLFGGAAVVLRVVRGGWTDVGALGRVNFLPDLGLAGALVLWLLTYGIGEETGWRGFALPRLQRNRSALAASLLLGGVWAGWHLPTLLYLPSYVQHGFAAVPGLVIGISLGSIVLTWLVNGSRGSVLPAIVWHTTFNYVTAAPASDPAISAIVTTAVMVWAVIVVLVWRRKD
jgi:CAAX protease family protein